MAHANRKTFGPGQQDQGKGDGSGAMGPLDVEDLPDTEILSNRDTSRHSDQRGLDGRHVQTERQHDHVDDHPPGRAEPGEAADDRRRPDGSDGRPDR